MLATYVLHIRKSNLAQVVQKVDNALRWINLYPVHTTIGFPNTYPLDSRIYPVDSDIQHFNNRNPGD